MIIAEELLAASQFNPAEFYKPSMEIVPDKTLCARCETNLRLKTSCYCSQCLSLRTKDYMRRKTSGEPVRKYNKKGGNHAGS